MTKEKESEAIEYLIKLNDAYEKLNQIQLLLPKTIPYTTKEVTKD